MEIKTTADIITLLKEDRTRWQALGYVEKLGLPDGCIGAGFVRNLLWDHLHGRQNDCLKQAHPEFKWSVKNQARMHVRNNDKPYTSIEIAMRSWPETATAIAVRRIGEQCAIIAPYGLDDILSMKLRPTSQQTHKLAAFNKRCLEKQWTTQKQWTTHWPKVIVVD